MCVLAPKYHQPNLLMIPFKFMEFTSEGHCQHSQAMSSEEGRGRSSAEWQSGLRKEFQPEGGLISIGKGSQCKNLELVERAR